MNDAELSALQGIARGAPIAEILTRLVVDLEARCEGMLGSVLLVVNGCVRHGAAPNLPAEYIAAIDGQAIGPKRGSCGTAAFVKEAVLVEDIETDPRWDDFRDVARRFGFRACWSIPILAADGAVLGTFAIYSMTPRRADPDFVQSLRDATSLATIALERHRYEETLRAGEARLRTIVDGGLDANITMDAKGAVTRWSPRAVEVFGWSAEEAIGQRLSMLIIPPASRERHERGLHEYLETGKAPLLGRRVELTALHRDGREIPVELAVTTFLDGGVPMFSAFVRDLTERVRAEQALRESEEQLAHIYDHVDDVVFQLAVEPGERYRFSAINAAFTAATGLKPSAVLGKFVDDVIPEPSLSFVRARYLEAIRTKKTVRWDETTAYPTGVRHGDVIVTPIFDADGRPKFLVGSVRDRTERQKLEEQLRHLQKIEAVNRLSAGVAHDFNNILAIILMSAQIALDGTAPPEEEEAILREIVSAAERGGKLTQQFLAFSRKQVFYPEALDLGDVVAKVVTLVRRLLGETITITTEGDAELDVVLADPTQIEQVLLNLVVNARDAMPTGGSLRIETRNRVVDAELSRVHEVGAGAFVMLSVADDGMGMDADVRARIFEPFFTTKEAGRGTGLGLSTVYGIVKQSGGFIEVTSAAGEGSTFRVHLPRATAEAIPARPNVVRASPRRALRHALVLEDDAALRTTLARALAMLRCRTTLAATAEEALAAIESSRGDPPELLIADTVTPGRGAAWLLEQLGDRGPRMKTLRVSGYPGTLASEPPSPGFAFLQKPFSISTLFAKIEELLQES